MKIQLSAPLSAMFVEDTTLSPLSGLGTLAKKTTGRCVGLGPQFYFIGLYIYPYANITLF